MFVFKLSQYNIKFSALIYIELRLIWFKICLKYQSATTELDEDDANSDDDDGDYNGKGMEIEAWIIAS